MKFAYYLSIKKLARAAEKQGHQVQPWNWMKLDSLDEWGIKNEETLKEEYPQEYKEFSKELLMECL